MVRKAEHSNKAPSHYKAIGEGGEGEITLYFFLTRRLYCTPSGAGVTNLEATEIFSPVLIRGSRGLKETKVQ